ncbi:MAG: hypothetical protein V7727_17845 [Sneathiella sp.]
MTSDYWRLVRQTSETIFERIRKKYPDLVRPTDLQYPDSSMQIGHKAKLHAG